MVTMTVAELREKLNEFPQDMPVVAQWEGTWNCFDAKNFLVQRSTGWHQDDNCDLLTIDVDQRWAR
jgi:hypothetical protein